jgi:hypothetical protein
VLQVHANPAAIADNQLSIDLLLAGYDLSFNNSWMGIRRESLSFPNLPSSWKNYTPNVPGNLYKNFVPLSQDASRSVLLEQRLLLPSLMLRLNARNSLAFFSTVRQFGNISGMSDQLANLFEKEFDLSVLQNNHVQNKNFRAIRMSWIEYGLSYGRVLFNSGGHCFKIGLSPKLMQGLESSYFILRDLDFIFSNKDTLSYLRADFEVAHSPRSGNVLNIAENANEKFRHSSGMSAGLDFGISYEWRPQPPPSGKDAPHEKDQKRPVTAQYKIKAGISVMDLGKIRFQKEPNYYEMSLYIRQTDIIRYLSAENVHMIDSLLQADYPANTGQDHFTVRMPTAINTQLDFSFNKRFYLNLSSHITGFNKNDLFQVHNYTAICLAPRFESYWLDVSVPLTWNQLGAERGRPIQPGIHVRAGPLSVGSNNLSFLLDDEISALNIYFMLRVSIPHRTVK